MCRRLEGSLALLAVLACGGEAGRGGEPVARVGDEALDASVVRHVAARDGVDEASARQRATETLQLVAARRERERAKGGETPPELPPARHDQLVRAARARLWLADVFEPAHGTEAIPSDDPLIARALASGEHVHPRLLALCQIVVGPKGVTDVDARAKITADEAWRVRARTVIDPIARRLEGSVHTDDEKPCDVIARLARFEAREVGDLAVELEGLAGFDLDACARMADDGSCAEPRFASEWVQAMRGAEVGFVGPFVTRFGWHLVFVQEVLPAQALDDPATDRRVREAVLEPWRARELGAALERMQQTRAVQLSSEAQP